MQCEQHNLNANGQILDVYILGESIVKELGLWRVFFFFGLDSIKTKKGFVENDGNHSS